MTVSELIERLKECQDQREPDLEVCVGIVSLAKRIAHVKRQTIFQVNGSNPRTVAMFVIETGEE